MSGPTVSYTVSLRRQRESRLTTPPASPCVPAAQPDAPAQATTAVTPIARLLALAYHLDRLMESGALKDQEDAGRRLGMAPSHVTHIMSLLQLAPDIQAAILAGRVVAAERALRPVCGLLSWDDQRASVQVERTTTAQAREPA